MIISKALTRILAGTRYPWLIQVTGPLAMTTMVRMRWRCRVVALCPVLARVCIRDMT